MRHRGDTKIDYIRAAMTPIHAQPPKNSIFHKLKCKIKCGNKKCKNVREIYVQDMHQVKLCVACQRKMRNSRNKKTQEVTSATTHRKRKARGQGSVSPSIPDFTDGQASDQNRPVLVI